MSGEVTTSGSVIGRCPPRERVVLRYLLDHWALERPDQVAVVFEGGASWTYAELRRRVRARAAGLEHLGAARGDRIAVWMFNGAAAIELYFAINYIGAVFVPFNTAYKGRILEHVLENSDARILAVDASLAPRLHEVDTAKIEVVLVAGGPATLPERLKSAALEDVSGDVEAVSVLERPLEPWDLQSIIYTSGTTGPSKGVLSSYMHLWSNAGPETWRMVTADDRYLVQSPIFHIGGMGPPYVMLARGASVVISEGFSTDRFWALVRETKPTVAFLLGVMATFLLKAAASDEDRGHSLRKVFVVPLTDSADELHRRFGVDVFTIFNMTEISTPILSAANPSKRGTCGRPRPGVEVRLVDGNDQEVPVGVVGEMIIRTQQPFAMNSGYNKAPEATAAAWRNGWFHTGDAFRKDEEGFFFFVDRIKDAIRRRGENISSFEVEAELCAHQDVREAAVIGVPSELTEDEVMAVIAPVPGRVIDPVELFRFAEGRLPYFMVPRYLRVLDDLPKTPSAKVMKEDLRRAGVTSDTWDAEKAGLRLRREKPASA